jgi:nucleoside-diphosphate-sugar epimerase
MNRVAPTVLLTGGTGFVGSHLAVALMDQGTHVVFLARDARGVHAEDRVRAVLAWHGRMDASRYSVAVGDVTSPGLGIGDDDLALLAGRCQEVWHCASETTFAEKRRSLLETVNVEGTRNLLDFAQRSSAGMVNYVSTAYAAGRVVGSCPEQVVSQDRFHNPYEETKHRAEALLVDRCTRAGIPFLLYRPSIVAGDSRTGRTLLFNGMYYPLRVLDYLRRQVLADWAETGGRGARQLGATVTDDGRVTLPIRVRTTKGSASMINVVAIDHVRDACLEIRHRAPAGSVCHLVHDHPVHMADLATLVRDVLRIDGVQVVGPEDPDTDGGILDTQFRSRIRVYLPYIDEEREFERNRTAAFVTAAPPPVDRPYLERCLLYALSQHWSSVPGTPAAAVAASAAGAL